jgi:hypothetical protein
MKYFVFIYQSNWYVKSVSKLGNKEVLCFRNLTSKMSGLTLFHRCYVSILSFLSTYIYGMSSTLLLFFLPLPQQSYKIVKLDQYGRTDGHQGTETVLTACIKSYFITKYNENSVCSLSGTREELVFA